jgi:hypothetical protein
LANLQDNYEQTKRQNGVQICELQTTISEYRSHEEALLKYIRELEQKNDDLERSHRYDISLCSLITHSYFIVYLVMLSRLCGLCGVQWKNSVKDEFRTEWEEAVMAYLEIQS